MVVLIEDVVFLALERVIVEVVVEIKTGSTKVRVLVVSYSSDAVSVSVVLGAAVTSNCRLSHSKSCKNKTDNY